jgi:hypothetical protein
MKFRSYLILTLTFVLLLSACQPAALSTDQPSAQPTDNQTSPEVTPPPVELSGELSFDLSGVAQDMIVETIAAVPANPEGPWWEALPEHQVATLQGYLVAEHLHKPQIFVYPVAELAQFNEVGGQIATELAALLQTQQIGDRLPYMPLYNASQVLHVQVQFLSFKNGSGVRYLTQFDQGVMPINNFELVYTFQGLTSDGKYYIAAVLPVTHPALPADDQVTPEQMEELSDFPAYHTKIVEWLNSQPADSFTPSLSTLDALVQSIEIK